RPVDPAFFRERLRVNAGNEYCHNNCMTSHEILLELKCVSPNVDRDATGALRPAGVMTRPRTASDIALIVSPIASSSAEFGQGYTPGVPKAFPLNRTRSAGKLQLGMPGDHDPTEEFRRGPRVAHALPDREIDWPRSGAREVPTSPPLARSRSRRHGGE